MDKLTARQKDVLKFLKYEMYEVGYVPTLADICKHFRIKSQNGARKHLLALERKGYIERLGGGRPRAIKIVKEN